MPDSGVHFYGLEHDCTDIIRDAKEAAHKATVQGAIRSVDADSYIIGHLAEQVRQLRAKLRNVHVYVNTMAEG